VLPPPHYPAGNYYTFPIAAESQAGVSTDILYAAPITIYQQAYFIAEAIDVTESVSGKCELGIYNDSSGTPGSLNTDFGSVSVDTTGMVSVSGTATLAAGTYWLAVGCDAGPQLADSGSSLLAGAYLGWSSGPPPAPYNGLTVSWTYSKDNLPSSFPSGATLTTNPMYLIFLDSAAIPFAEQTKITHRHDQCRRKGSSRKACH